MAANSLNNLLFSNMGIKVNEEQHSSVKQQQLQQITILNKSQLQQVLIHLLTTDDKFLSSLHQAYLETNLTLLKKSNKHHQPKAQQQHSTNLKPLLFNETNSSSLEIIMNKACKLQN